MKRIGLDAGSTTLKCVVLDKNGKLVFDSYTRHRSKVVATILEELKKVRDKFPHDKEMQFAISGSAGLGFAEQLELPFVQEVYATRVAADNYQKGSDVIIELGGEDAKIIFLTNGFEMRMNGTCAGGTGAFIDQMISLLKIESDEMNSLAQKSERIYEIASRCGVFAKSDIQPLLNQGARKEDLAASIFKAVVNQTISGLAQGRKIEGNILYLGGPLTYFSSLRHSFDDSLGLKGICPENSKYYVALGASISKFAKTINLNDIIKKFENYKAQSLYKATRPLFENKQEYNEFLERHKKTGDRFTEITELKTDELYLGVDAGSTTIKAILIDDNGNIYKPFYHSNEGNPIPLIQKYLLDLYKEHPNIKIKAASSTGYGEDLLKNAFRLDFGLVETVAHYTAAKEYIRDVDFIIDIGGQDIKCFKIRNNAIDSLYLNEACSSGCGSFLQTFANALGYSMQEFTSLGLFAKKPVDLGTRCTVFMNSSVKQAQKDGASIEDISAGLSISVIKNALYKVIRCVNADSLGKNIIVQGGTFLNDSVLRVFEMEVGRNVIRPKYSGLMGALGAALYAKEHVALAQGNVITKEELENFKHKILLTNCKGCTNLCHLTVNQFSTGEKYIAGNRCDKFVNNGRRGEQKFDMYEYKLGLLKKYKLYESPNKSALKIGLPLGLNMYELLPFWYTFFKELGFSVVASSFGSRSLYIKGQQTIPSDTVCYPAKMMHGAIEKLIEKNVDAIFYPSMSYNINEHKSDNHFNCPIVGYYPQLLGMNVDKLKNIKYINDFLTLDNKEFFPKRIYEILKGYFSFVSKKDIKRASKKAYEEYNEHLKTIREKAEEILDNAEKTGERIIVLAGRPYHIDPEISHGISNLISRMGAIVLSEDSISHLSPYYKGKVLNQWTYHARMYSAAHKIVSMQNNVDIDLIQIVSFGCGLDAVTSDEVKRIIEEGGKIYTQLKVDEISNLGAVKIRLRSLFSALDEKKLFKAMNE